MVTLFKNMRMGAFHGRISPQTPTGCFRVYPNVSPSETTYDALNFLYFVSDLYTYLTKGITLFFQVVLCGSSLYYFPRYTEKEGLTKYVYIGTNNHFAHLH